MESRLNTEAKRVHEANRKWWVDLETGKPLNRNVDEMLMLTVSELAEAMEGHRKNLPDDKLPHRGMPEVELADALIRLLDMAGAYEFDFSNPRRVAWGFGDNFAQNLLQIVRMVSAEYINHETLEARVVVACYSILELAQKENMDIWGAYEEKMVYNATRVDHTREHRMGAGGKKY